jgi:single-stranded-DNA-specific exonuclease
MQSNWRILEPGYDEINRLSQALGISSFLARFLINRKILDPIDAGSFLNPQISDLGDPFLFKDMGKAVQRIKKAISKKEKILIYGDYDVDGVTGCAVLMRTLKAMGVVKVDCYIPHRVDEGYGISSQGVKFAADTGVNVVITVDCGITNASQVEDLNRQGIDVIITDHHEPAAELLPQSAHCLLNPLCPAESYPDKNLSGVGVAFKLAQALGGDCFQTEDMLDLVALGTVADVCLLRGENRILVKHGLSRIGETKNVGIKALLEVAQLNKRIISVTDVGFILGPRINAMGRLDSAEMALKLFLTDSLTEALGIARTLDTMNRKRQEIELEIYNGAVNRIEREINFKHEQVIVLGDQSWHQGVLGIVASKLAERYSRPVILFSAKDKIASGSGRTNLENVNLFKVIDRCSHLFKSYGGHKSACGIKMDKDLLGEFRARFNQAVKGIFETTTFIPTIYIDAEFPFDAIDSAWFEEFNKLAPFGEGNPWPTFVSRKVHIKNIVPSRNGLNKRLPAVWVSDGRATYEATGKDFVNWATGLAERREFDLVYQLKFFTDRKGDRHISLKVEDFNPLNSQH